MNIKWINYISDKNKKRIVEASQGDKDLQLAIQHELEEIHNNYWELTAMTRFPVRNLPTPKLKQVLNKKNIEKIKKSLHNKKQNI